MRELVIRTLDGAERAVAAAGDLEAATATDDPLQLLLEDMSMQVGQLLARGDEVELEVFRVAWRYGELCSDDKRSKGALNGQAPEVAMRAALQKTESVAEEKLEEMREVDLHFALIGEEIMSEFLLDIIGRGTNVARIFENNASSHYDSAEIVSLWKKVLAFLVVLTVNVACVTFAILKGSIRGKEWQQQYLFGCILQFMVEIVVFETSVILWAEVVVPQLVFDGVNSAFRDVMHTIDALSADYAAAKAGAVETAPVNVFNVPDHLFVSTRLARVFSDHVESSIVTRYESIFPSRSLVAVLHPPLESIPEGATGMFKWLWTTLRLSLIGSLLLSIAISIAVIPMAVQEFIISIIQPILYAVVILVVFQCLLNPWLAAVVLLGFAVTIFVLYHYINYVSERQLAAAEAQVQHDAAQISATGVIHVDSSDDEAGPVLPPTSPTKPSIVQNLDLDFQRADRKSAKGGDKDPAETVDSEADVPVRVPVPPAGTPQTVNGRPTRNTASTGTTTGSSAAITPTVNVVSNIDDDLHELHMMHVSEGAAAQMLEDTMQSIKAAKHQKLQERLAKKADAYSEALDGMVSSHGHAKEHLVRRHAEKVLREQSEKEARILDEVMNKVFAEHVDEQLTELTRLKQKEQHASHTLEEHLSGEMADAHQRLHDKIESRRQEVLKARINQGPGSPVGSTKGGSRSGSGSGTAATGAAPAPTPQSDSVGEAMQRSVHAGLAEKYPMLARSFVVRQRWKRAFERVKTIRRTMVPPRALPRVLPQHF